MPLRAGETCQLEMALVKLTAALFDPEAAVMVALIELNELREKYGECKADRFQQDAEQQAQSLLANCEEIKDAERSVDLIFEVPAFDAHYERYYNETEGQR